MECEENFITMKLIWHNYLVFSLGNCVHKTPTETDLKHLQPAGRQGQRAQEHTGLGARGACEHSSESERAGEGWGGSGFGGEHNGSWMKRNRVQWEFHGASGDLVTGQDETPIPPPPSLLLIFLPSHHFCRYD